MYGDYEKRMKKKGEKNKAQANDNGSVNQEFVGDDNPENLDNWI
jgi:hypothetical protein